MLMISIKKLPLYLVPMLGLLGASCSTTPVAPSTSANSNQQSRQTTVIKSTTPTTQTRATHYGIASHQRSNSEDRLGSLIRESDEAYQSDQLSIEQRTRIRPLGKSGYSTENGVIVNNLDFNQWMSISPYRASEVAQYQSYLAGYVGAYAVPPMNQLLTTARSWERCGYAPYQLPPRELWSNMVMTLKLFDNLKSQGVLPPSTEIRSVYRSPDLNACAGGANASKHMSNGAIDIWVPEYDGQPWYLGPMQEKLCQFWSAQGERYNFGLGLYSTGAVHLDTQGYRLWGAENSSYGSYCRYM